MISMTARALIRPETIQVNRSDLRTQQSKFLQKASGNRIVLVVGREEEEKYVVDRKYLDEVIAKLRSAMETMNVMKDQRLFAQILKASETIDEDIRLGKLHSFEEAFGEE
jgi:CTP:phosphocholine cytidylyltransferase-like protein